MKATFYALKQLELIGSENGFKPYVDGESMFIEFRSGKTLKISDDEIKYQAEEYLKSEIELLGF